MRYDGAVRPEEIDDRIRRLMWLRAYAFLPGTEPWHDAGIRISELRWVLGEMDVDLAGSLIEKAPNGRMAINIGPFYTPEKH